MTMSTTIERLHCCRCCSCSCHQAGARRGWVGGSEGGGGGSERRRGILVPSGDLRRWCSVSFRTFSFPNNARRARTSSFMRFYESSARRGRRESLDDRRQQRRIAQAIPASAASRRRSRSSPARRLRIVSSLTYISVKCSEELSAL